MKYGYPSGKNNKKYINLISKVEYDDPVFKQNLRVFFIKNKNIFMELPNSEEICEIIDDILLNQAIERNNSSEKFWLENTKKGYIFNSLLSSMMAAMETAMYLEDGTKAFLFLSILLSLISIYGLSKLFKNEVYLNELKKYEIYLELYEKYIKKTGLTLTSDEKILDIRNLDDFSLGEVKSFKKDVGRFFDQAVRERKKKI